MAAFGNSAAGDDVLIKQYAGIALLLTPAFDAKPADLAANLKQRLSELRSELPEGMLLTLPINLAETADPRETHLLLELQPAPEFDPSRLSLELSNTSTRLRELPGINNWICFRRHPLDASNPNPCVLIHATAAQPEQSVTQKIQAAIKELLAASKEINVQLKSFGKPDAALICAAICGPDVSSSRGFGQPICRETARIA